MLDSTTRSIVILGATSAMAEQTARRLIKAGHNLLLVARNEERLSAVASDLRTRGSGNIVTVVRDLTNVPDTTAFFDLVARQLGGLDTVLMFHGYLGDGHEFPLDADEIGKVINTNFTSHALLALAAQEKLEKCIHPRPVLLTVGSVAGDRGRAANYLYGASKSGIATLFEGMAHKNALVNKKVAVLVVKAGLTDTPMTEGFNKDGLLWSSAEVIAGVIVKAIERGGPVIYAPFYWRYIMLVIRFLPTFILHRLDL